MVEQKKTRELRPRPLRVLPCADAKGLSTYFTVLQGEIEIDLLPITRISSLSLRVQSDQPDAIVIATEEFAGTAWRNNSSLGDVFSVTPTLLLVGEVNVSLKRRAKRFHIRSTLPLNATTDQLLAAISATVAGLAVTLEPSWLEEEERALWSAADKRFAEGPPTEHLTARETVVLRLMALGHGNKEIAVRLNISEHTVKFHVSSVLAKLGAESRTEAVTIGIVRGHVAI
jgi:DNA-binding NarL/FixJ family response regulator